MALFSKRQLYFFGLLCLAFGMNAQKTALPPAFDSLTESHIRAFKTVAVADTNRAIVTVLVFETGKKPEAIQGATVLLRRDKDKVLGRVTKQDGSCKFSPLPATYSIRVQLTGYKNLESSGLVLSSGHIYEMELRLARN